MSTFRVKITGQKRLAAALKKYRGNLHTAVSGAIFEEGSDLLDESKRRVPVDTGNLRASGFVSHPAPSRGGVKVTVGYGGTAAPYAWQVHENPRSGKTGGIGPAGQHYKTYAATGGWKYLEAPFMERRAGVSARVASRIWRRLRGTP